MNIPEMIINILDDFSRNYHVYFRWTFQKLSLIFETNILEINTNIWYDKSK